VFNLVYIIKKIFKPTNDGLEGIRPKPLSKIHKMGYHVNKFIKQRRAYKNGKL